MLEIYVPSLGHVHLGIPSSSFSFKCQLEGTESLTAKVVIPKHELTFLIYCVVNVTCFSIHVTSNVID